jgi:hypothetical protein
LEKVTADLPGLRRASITSNKDRKRLLRTLMADVTVLFDPDRGAAQFGMARPCQVGSAGEPHVDSAQSLRREALTGMTVVDYDTPLPELLESAYEAVRSFNHRTSGGAMIAPEAYRILGETMAFADVFRQALGQFANGLRPHERTAVLLRTLWAYRGLGGDLTRTAAAHAVNRSTARYRLHHIRELKVGASGNGPRR